MPWSTFWDKGRGLEESIYKMSSGGTKTIPQQCQNNDCVKLHWWRPSIQCLLPSARLTLTSSLFIKFIFQADTLALCIASPGIPGLAIQSANVSAWKMNLMNSELVRVRRAEGRRHWIDGLHQCNFTQSLFWHCWGIVLVPPDDIL